MSRVPSPPFREAANTADGALGYEGVALGPSSWEPNPAYTRIAKLLVGAFLSPPGRGGDTGGGFLAVQWRSEDAGALAQNSSGAFAPCAGWAADRINKELREGNLTAAFLATDLRRGASTT